MNPELSADYVSLEEFLEELRVWVRHTREEALFSTLTVLNDLERKLNEVLDADQSDGLEGGNG